MANLGFENFRRDLVDAIEEHMPSMDSDKANDIAWEISEAFAWQIWAEIEHRASTVRESRAEKSPWENVGPHVRTERGRCEWHDAELLEMVPDRRGEFYCIQCAQEYRITKHARPAGESRG